jgi:hypothetical protein
MSYHALHYPENAKPETAQKYEKFIRNGNEKSIGRAALAENLDEGVALLLKKIDALGIADNTYVIYMSDNGGGCRTPTRPISGGDYKLLHYYEDGHDELYNLTTDLKESRNLAAKLPEKTADLNKRLFTYLGAINADLPKMNSEYDPSKTQTAKRGGGQNRDSRERGGNRGGGDNRDPQRNNRNR